MNFNSEIIDKEINFKTSRSGGKGGQYVNKVSTKVMLIFNIINSKAFDENQKEILINYFKKRLTNDGNLIITSESERSQYLNKKKCIEKLYSLLLNALEKKRQRIKTQPTKESKEKRIKEKKILSEKKMLRRKDFLN